MSSEEFFPPFFAAALLSLVAFCILAVVGVSGFFLAAGTVTAFVVSFWYMWEFN